MQKAPDDAGEYPANTVQQTGSSHRLFLLRVCRQIFHQAFPPCPLSEFPDIQPNHAARLQNVLIERIAWQEE